MVFRALKYVTAATAVMFAYASSAAEPCDLPEVRATVQSLATRYMRANKDYVYQRVKIARGSKLNAMFGGEPDYKVTAVRDRGTLGQGRQCAANVHASLRNEGQPDLNGAELDLLAEYSVEPTLDGKTAIQAKFSVNP